MNLQDKLNDKGIKLTSYRDGSTHKVTCPSCSHTRKKKTDPCLSVKIDDDGQGATWTCHHCADTGGVTTKTRAYQTEVKKREYQKPVINRQSVSKHDKDLTAFFSSRGISEDIIERNKIVTALEWMPAAQAETKVIVFPFFVGGEVVNFKFRGKDKDFKQSKGAMKVLYGMDNVPDGADTLIITEGEIDCLSCNQAGLWNAVSIPDGALSAKTNIEDNPERFDSKFEYIANCEGFLNSFDKIIVAMDGDVPGLKMRDELARRLGKEKCYFLTYPDGTKDLNDVLLKQGEHGVREVIASAYPCPVGDLFAANDFLLQVMELYDGTQKQGLSTGWITLDPYLKWFKKMLTIVTGSPGSGKSEWVDAALNNLAKERGWKIAYASLENSPARHIHKLTSKYLQCTTTGDYKCREDRFKEGLNWVNQHYKFIYPQGNESPTIDWVLSKARAAVMRDGIDALVIDPYNCFEHNIKTGQSETNYISSMLTKIKLFAEHNDVLVVFVAHPQKMSRDKNGKAITPTLNDISGSNSWWSKADYGIVVHRDRGEDGSRDTEAEIHVQKVRFQPDMGTEGMIKLKFIPQQSRYIDVDP